MTPEYIVDLFRSALYLSVVMVSIILVPGLLVGLMVAMFQAATQINEQTLSFLPRLIATFVVLSVAGPLLGSMLFEFTERLITNIPFVIG